MTTSVHLCSDRFEASAHIARPLNQLPFVRVWVLPQQSQDQTRADAARHLQGYYEAALPNTPAGTAQDLPLVWLEGFVAGLQTSAQRSGGTQGSLAGTKPGNRTAQTWRQTARTVLRLARFQCGSIRAQFSSLLVFLVGGFGSASTLKPAAQVGNDLGGNGGVL
jgi:hypothetical protein